MILDGLYNSKLQDSVQLQTALAMYEQENVRNNGQPSCSRLKTAARRHTDQIMRTRNFRARNEIVEIGTVTKSHNGRIVSVERRVGECYQWKANGQCLKGDSCSFRHEPASGNRCAGGRKEQSSSPAPEAKAQTDGKIPSKGSNSKGESPSWTRGRIPCKDVLGRKCTNPSCNLWHPPVCCNYESESGCTYGEKCKFHMLRLMANLA